MLAHDNNLVLLLGLFIFKHYVADFLLQNMRHISNKGFYGRWGGIEHALHHALLTACILFAFVSWHIALLFGLIDGILHYHIDYIKTRFGPKDPAKSDFWVWHGTDQLLHYATYFAIIYKL